MPPKLKPSRLEVGKKCLMLQENIPLFVNDFFMKCVNSFMKTVFKNALQIEHYWGHVEFAPGRGVIYLHVVAIAKGRAYLQDFF
jgi:hypothetical protein